MNMNMLLWIGILIMMGFLITYIWGDNATRKNVNKIQKVLAGGMMPTVSAGSHYKEIPSQIQSISTKYNLFKNPFGQALNTTDYNSYLVQGDSMQYCNIHTGDVVFAQKDFQLSDLTKFPSVVILKNHKATPEQCQYKIRRAWVVCADNLGDSAYVEIVKGIMRSPDYLILKDKAKSIYESDDKMLDGFMGKLRKYRADGNTDSFGQGIVISSTYDVDEKKSRFSIHRASSLIGVVRYVTSINTQERA